MASKDKKFTVVDEAIVVAALGGNVNSTSSNDNVKLRSLNSAQLCQLFDYCYLYNLGGFIYRNNLIGMLNLDNFHNFSCLIVNTFTSFHQRHSLGGRH